MALRNHVRCRELQGTLKFLEKRDRELSNQIVRHIENVGNLRGQIHIEENTLSSLAEAVEEMRRSLARSGARVAGSRTIRGGIRNAGREAAKYPHKIFNEYNRQKEKLKATRAALKQEEFLLEYARQERSQVQQQIRENYRLQRQNHC